MTAIDQPGSRLSADSECASLSAVVFVPQTARHAHLRSPSQLVCGVVRRSPEGLPAGQASSGQQGRDAPRPGPYGPSFPTSPGTRSGRNPTQRPPSSAHLARVGLGRTVPGLRPTSSSSLCTFLARGSPAAAWGRPDGTAEGTLAARAGSPSGSAAVRALDPPPGSALRPRGLRADQQHHGDPGAAGATPWPEAREQTGSPLPTSAQCAL